ncbi:MAG: tRNA epoxyqueuosine(34) reductase QueG [Nitrospira sp.]|nr:MAG: tRNA epoxyqueuosine(34) reductase QueG [Nitrospira sp.]
MSLADTIKREALALGFAAVGIARVVPAFPEPSDLPPLTPDPLPLTTLLFERLRAWLDRGYHATMAWLAKAPERRADPTHVLPGCRSMVCVGTHYYTGHPPREHPGHGRIARYAWGQDYHHVVLPRLEQLAERIRALAPGTHTRCYVDTGPIMEKAWAQEAGLGWIGKHSNLVSAQFGSWLLLGEVLTTLDLEPDEPGQDLCGSCTLCIKACPTGAIAEPYVVDAARCISYLTIERHHPGQDIDPELQPRLGNRIFGCDDCLDVCPYNTQAPVTTEPASQPSRLTAAPSLEALARLTASDFDETFRRSPIRRARHAGLLRNVRIAQANETRPVPWPLSSQ